MPKIHYQNWRPDENSLATVAQANEIIEAYAAKGFDLTLRQLYYQFVARDIIPNKDVEYNRLGAVVNRARLAGLMDWKYITDRTRNVEANSHWTNPGSIIRSAAYSFMLDRWRGQPYRIEVWIEKDALRGVIAGVCEELDVPHFSCRGYTSQSEMWRAGQRLVGHNDRDQKTIILHFGDHDPSGIDMTRDIHERLEMFTGGRVVVNRMALNMPQVEELGPPPNPAKLSDSRAKNYILTYGNESWELDALEPEYIGALIREAVDELRDEDLWDKTMARERHMKTKLDELAEEHGHDDWD
jgi:hypothetical protein